MGKLFSTILLERLIKYRKYSFPDPPNQLGFTKGAQTYDHILTMNTIASKYKKLFLKPVCSFCACRKTESMLYECNLYEDIRAKLITRLNKSPLIQNTHPNNPELTLFIDQQALRTNLLSYEYALTLYDFKYQ